MSEYWFTVLIELVMAGYLLLLLFLVLVFLVHIPELIRERRRQKRFRKALGKDHPFIKHLNP